MHVKRKYFNMIEIGENCFNTQKKWADHPKMGIHHTKIKRKSTKLKEIVKHK